jgi:hypothetical protein
MKRWTLLLVWACAPLAFSEDKPADAADNPVQILKKVDAATKAVDRAQYEVVAEGLDDSKDQMPRLEGKYLIDGWSERGDGGGTVAKFKAELKAKSPGSEKEVHLTFGSDGQEYYLIDHDTKKVYVDMDRAVMGARARLLYSGMMLEFVHPEPFNDEINAEKSEIKGETEIDGEKCWEIHVKYAQAGQEATWFMCKKDMLPRRRVDVVPMPNGKAGKFQKTISKLVVDPQVDADAFKLVVPEGYEKEKDFAP